MCKLLNLTLVCNSSISIEMVTYDKQQQDTAVGAETDEDKRRETKCL